MWNLRFMRTALGAAAMAMLAACGDNEVGFNLKSSDKEFAPEEMEQKIRDIYEGKVTGFSFTISQNGKLERAGGWGWARRPGDGSLPMSENTRVQLASVSKTVNAIYFLHVLRRINDFFGHEHVALDHAVSFWLPNQWVKGAGFAGSDGVSFRELLTHASGLRQMWDDLNDVDRQYWGNDWDGLEFVVANGTMPGSQKGYKNANSALFRILIPQLLRESGVASLGDVSADSAGLIYVEYLNSYILSPLGMAPVNCGYREEGDYAKLYDFDAPDKGGLIWSGSTANCGGHAGLYMSAMEMATLLAYARHDDQILDDMLRSEMSADALGWYNSIETHDDIALAKLRKGGRWILNYPHSSNDADQDRAEARTCVIMYPRQVEAVLLINSSLASGTPSPCSGLDQAYQAAFK